MESGDPRRDPPDNARDHRAESASPDDRDSSVDYSTLTDVDAVNALLDRVVQRIHTAGLVLQMVSDKVGIGEDAGTAIRELDGAVSDIHSTVLSWTTGDVDISPRRSTDELGTVIDHLTAAVGTLGQLVARTNAGDDGCRFAAINDSDHLVRCALVMLLDVPGPLDGVTSNT
jgi:hypothetical protein